ncbi:hypothetical protein [Mycobacteroides abscessus]|uniref:hypothetical protein n=1 Tax=Mycobacteroides abscessus TaxID=36809 RepID=UPI00092C61F9|nr:hypothetical protein [Mycobacteroides abscessus]DAZ90266.1 TPA_asm: hypothetical protein PROPHIFSIL01-1_79 [Mycobacterium phage prophiFSIL01-1]SHZ93217.1 Uncharacterised protein [Mycobacteroides abscessus subsp. abscessus]SIA06637.1 Uncharacterised protein [Mycobacteroides abscessus subsp. abscessus]SIA64631.1 Uncharacterised protein [Mycobacteroides abscessus subsp. abscessus]SIA69624.1 Uncharacterised protein [Mycobacteroides abscessus subsp. abscessus]
MIDEAVLNAICATMVGYFDEVSLHNAEPGAGGANEMPGVVRKTPTWATADNGESTSVVTFAAYVGTSTHIGFWNAGAFVASRPFVTNFETAADLVVALNPYVQERA